MADSSVHPTPARNLKSGDLIRLTDDRFSRVVSLGFEDGQLIVGGPETKTATAIRIITEDGANLLVHPGQLIGLKGGTKRASSRKFWMMKV